MKTDGGSDKNTPIKNEYGRRRRRTECCIDCRSYTQHYVTLDHYIITGATGLRLQVADYWSGSEVTVNFSLKHCWVLQPGVSQQSKALHFLNLARPAQRARGKMSENVPMCALCDTTCGNFTPERRCAYKRDVEAHRVTTVALGKQ
jgi:hypothetical protein